MLNYFNKKVCVNFFALLGIIISIGNICLCYAAVVIKELPVVDYSVIYKTEMDNTYLNVSEYPGNLCYRECVPNDVRVCHFDFTLEYYQAMGVACGNCAKGVEEDCNNPECIAVDGVEKGVMSINRQIPGPAIHVCKDDLIVVDIHNHARGTAASLHWHGIHMKKTPYMDGVPFLTQCPIPFGTSFRYQFHATESGTQFYHSHSGHHKVNGQFGALIVREPKKSYDYDFDWPEHYIIINDWMHANAEHHDPGLPSSNILPDTVLINGRGLHTDPKTREQIKAPPTVYYVQPGYRYRFRIINSGNHVCPFQMEIQDHDLTIIASDSFDVLPFVTDALVTNSGERYDFVINTNHTGGDFLIRVRGMDVCIENFIESFAVLRYRRDESKTDFRIPSFPEYEETYPSTTFLNHPTSPCNHFGNTHCVTEMIAVDNDRQLYHAKPDHRFYLAFQNYEVPNSEVFNNGEYNHFVNIGSNTTVIGTINKIALTFPDYPLLTQPDLIDESQFCNTRNKPARCANKSACHCIHRLKVALNSIVELIIVDETEDETLISHPFHLHGYRFMVTGMGRNPTGLPMTVNRVQILDDNNKLLKFTSRGRPPFKDTISIPSRGYAAVRFRATNPGFWLMHCHYDWHLANGMGLILQVGGTSKMVRPPSDFPKCGSYLPPVRTQQPSQFSNLSGVFRYSHTIIHY